MFRFIKKIFLTGLAFSSSLVSTTPLSCISTNNQACNITPEIINVNSNEPVFYLFSIKTSKCSGSCNNINDLYPNMCGTCVCQELMKHSTWKDIKRVSVNVD